MILSCRDATPIGFPRNTTGMLAICASSQRDMGDMAHPSALNYRKTIDGCVAH
jgi:hypothetical protein